MVQRITLPYLAHELNHAITHTDKGILLLIKDLFYRPGHIAREYVEGKRKKYFNPLSFLVISSAITAYICLKVGYFHAFNDGASDSVRSKSMELITENQKLLELVLIFPLLAFFSWIYFNPRKFTFAEVAVLGAFLLGQMNVLRVFIFVPVFLITSLPVETVDNMLHVVTLVYFIVAFRQFFHQHIALTIIKAILVTVSYIVFFWLFVMGYVWLVAQW